MKYKKMEAIFIRETFYKVRYQGVLFYSHKFWFPSVFSQEFKEFKDYFSGFSENLNLKKGLYYNRRNIKLN
jgi:hypothetical protein